MSIIYFKINILNIFLFFQKYDLFVVFNIILPNCTNIKRDSNEWKLYIQLRKIVDFLESDFYDKKDVEIVQKDIEHFVYNYSFIIQHVKPKVHVLTHIEKLIKEFSVLKLLSTLRLERLHKLNKTAIKTSQNFISLPLQVVKFWALNFTQNSFTFELIKTPKVEYNNNEILKYVPNLLLKFLDKESQLIVYTDYQLNNLLLIEEYSFFLINYNDENGLPVFIKIDFIFEQAGKTKFICKIIKTLEFIKNIYSFKVRILDDYVEYSEENLVDQIKFHKKLFYLKLSTGTELINKNFYIPYEFSKNYD